MIHLITGGSGSGKSAYGENWLKERVKEGKLLYIATMEPFGEEAKMRILRHHKLREGKGFETLECYRNLGDADVPVCDGILLECMSNLVANELFQVDGALNDRRKTRENILSGIEHLCENSEYLTIVTNEVTADLQPYSEETKIYQQLIGEVNQELAKMADCVTEVVYGIPVRIK